YICRRVKSGDGIRTVQGIEIRTAMELHRRSDDAGAWSGRCIDLNVPFSQCRISADEAEQRSELLIRPHRDQVATRRHPIAEHRDLCSRQYLLTQNDHVVG